MDAFRYDGRRALVVGGASGIGAAVAALVGELGGEVTILDHVEVTGSSARSLVVDLRDQASIDKAVTSGLGPVDALFSCAGVANDSPGVDFVNFVGQRHLIDSLVASGDLVPGSAVAMIASAAGLGWERNLEALVPYVESDGWEGAVAYLDDHPELSGYAGSKQAVCAFVARRAHAFLKRGIRINAILPGPTDTPLARANADVWLGFAADYRDDVGINASTADEQAHPLVFLCSGAASHIAGVTFPVDAGYIAAGVTGAWDAPMVRKRLGIDP